MCALLCVLFSTASDVGFTSSRMTSPRQMLSQLFCQLQSTCHSRLFGPFIGHLFSDLSCPVFFHSQLAGERLTLCRPHLVFTQLVNISLKPRQLNWCKSMSVSRILLLDWLFSLGGGPNRLVDVVVVSGGEITLSLAVRFGVSRSPPATKMLKS